MPKKSLTILLLTSLTIVAVYFGLRHNEADKFKDKQFNDSINAHTRKYIEFSRKLELSERRRLALAHSLDSIDLVSKSNRNVNDSLRAELIRVKGFYDKKSATELERLMIEKYNAAQRIQ